MTVETTENQWSSVSDPGSARSRVDRRHRIILRPEQILFDLDADPTWSEYDQADRELAEREERLERAPGATSGADRGDAVRVLRQRLEVQQITELAEYGARLADAVRGALAPGAGVDVVVELDTDLDTWGPVVIPLAGLGADAGALAAGIAAAITATATPRDLPGSPLERLAAQ